MLTKFESSPIAAIEADALLIIDFEAEGRPDSATRTAVNQLTAGWLDELNQSGEFSGKAQELAILHRPAGLASKRLVAAGAGKASAFNTAALRKVAGSAVRALKAKGVKSIALYLDPAYLSAAFASAAVEGAILAGFEPDVHKSKPETKKVESFVMAGAADSAEAVTGAERGRILAESQNFTRELVNEPANLLPPRVLAARAAAMAAESGLECEILDQDRMRQLGMGALLGVAQGSSEPPALIVVRYRPANASSADHLGLVGKGVTFDTGGVSIKPSEGMEKMKYDMAGGAAVLGAMRAIAHLKPSIAVTALVPAVENMVSHNAQRPGDIVTAMNGKTIEVLNTDAEGRLILADALEYARRLGCTHLVDAATLTGAIGVALGHIYAGVFSTSDPLCGKFMAAAESQGEKMWRMPLDEDYKEYLKNAFADLPNIGGRHGGAITAAYFLKEFTGDTPWVHLDIAGTAWLDSAKPFLSQGPSGVCVRSFVELALSW